MYPNYSKTFLDLEDVLIRKVVHADSFYKSTSKLVLLNKHAPAVLRKPGAFMIIAFRKSRIFPTLENMLLWFWKAALCLYFLWEALSGTLFVPAILSPQNETIDLLCCEPIKRILLLKTSCKPYRGIRPNGFKAFRYSCLRGPVKAASSGFYRWIQRQCLYWKISVYSGWSSEATHSGYPSRSNPESSRILLEKYFSKRTVKSSVLCLRYVAALRGFGTNLFSECKNHHW